MVEILLPVINNKLELYKTGPASTYPKSRQSRFNRIAFAAAHVVPDPLLAIDPSLAGGAIDWEATLNYRRHLWRLGFGVAEAMDTAQRGMGLNWTQSLELIEKSIDAAGDIPGAIVACGAGTDQLEMGPHSIDQVIGAYLEQCCAIEKLGGRIILMASRALVSAANTADDYIRVYNRVLSDVNEPVIIHWLGDMFDPALSGYWGHQNTEKAMQVCLNILEQNVNKIDGIKISLLDKNKEISMRQRLPPGVRMYTGDDFNYAELIDGDTVGHSDALLGIFDAIAPAASEALQALTDGDVKLFHSILAPTVPLSRHIFAEPTRFYKTGIVFMAYLNGMQNHFTMIGAQQGSRSIVHLAEIFRLADKAGLLTDPDLAVNRMKAVLVVHGLEV